MIEKGITVYCASSANVDEAFFNAATELGTLIAENNLPLINGGGSMGLMGAVNNGCLQAGGIAVGVIPQFMVDRGWHHKKLSQLIVTPDMHTRKETMASMARGVIALPGGCGTFEELLEIITWRQLGLFGGNVVILNTLGYYDPLIEMFRQSIEKRFMKPDHALIWQVASTPAEALQMAMATPLDMNFSKKF